MVIEGDPKASQSAGVVVELLSITLLALQPGMALVGVGDSNSITSQPFEPAMLHVDWCND